MDENKLDLQNTAIPFPSLPKRRRKMLPWWVLVFVWLFFAFAALIPFGIIFTLLGRDFDLSLLGLTTREPFSTTGIILIILFAFKGVVSFGLWMEKKWGVSLAKIDAILSIVICCAVMCYSFFVLHSFSLRLELIVIIPYFYKMNQIQHDWVYGEDVEQVVSTNPE